MYATELAVNHIIAKYGLKVPEKRKLDCPTSSQDSVYDCWMFHSWFGDVRFSKHQMQDGLYANITLEELNVTIARDYCTYMALDGNRTPLQQLSVPTHFFVYLVQDCGWLPE